MLARPPQLRLILPAADEMKALEVPDAATEHTDEEKKKPKRFLPMMLTNEQRCMIHMICPKLPLRLYVVSARARH
jgi:hypothetical protein